MVELLDLGEADVDLGHSGAPPLLIAHGERDERVHPKQSEELVAELRRLGKTYEYVTYPTEAHGFLRAGPQIDFDRRLVRAMGDARLQRQAGA